VLAGEGAEDVGGLGAAQLLREDAHPGGGAGLTVAAVDGGGVPVALVEFGQGYQSMSPAIKVFETKLLQGTLRHDGNPCLTWCASNVVAVQDAAENKKYDKSRSIGRIDGIVAAVMACGIIEELPDKSIYEGMTPEQIRDRMAFK
jgi:phage terminase large subunit-like protein